MKIYSRAINIGETFCTSKKQAKNVFENTEVKLCFGAFRKKYTPYQNEIGYGYYKRNIHGQVVSNMILEPGVNCPMLKFYIVKSDGLSSSTRDDFESNVLYRLRDIYFQFCSTNALQQKTTVIWVELLDDKLYIHQFIS